MQGRGPHYFAKVERSEREALSYVGKRIGHLTVSAYVGRVRGRPVMTYVCVCGVTRNIQLSQLKLEQHRSCGCHGLTAEESELRDCYRDLITKARNRDLSLDLTVEQARALFKSPCHYCGRTHINLPRASKRTREMNVSLNGIDRVDNDVGYVVGNVVACCGECNHAKGTMPAAAFIALCARISARHTAWMPFVVHTANQERQT